MMNKRQQKWFLSAAVAAAMPAMFAMPSAQAQYLSPDDGHALDANNFQGSNGRNDPTRNANGGTASGNQIVTGNVTGGKAFRGQVQCADRRAFRGSSVGNVSDTFVRDSYGTPSRNSPAFSLDGARTFYGVARAVAPPTGTVREGFTGSYVGTTLQPISGGSIVSPLAVLRDQRLGGLDIVGVQPGTIPQGNQVELPSPGQEQGNLYLGSALLGPRTLQNGVAVAGPIQPAGNPLVPSSQGTALVPGANGYVDRFAADIGMERQPLGAAVNPLAVGQPAPPAGGSSASPNQLPGQTPAPLNSPLNAQVGAAPGNAGPQESFMQRMVVPASEQKRNTRNCSSALTRPTTRSRPRLRNRIASSSSSAPNFRQTRPRRPPTPQVDNPPRRQADNPP